MTWLERIAVLVVWAVLGNVAQADDKWVADEIFMQMSDMRKEIVQLKERVADLEQKLVDRQPKLSAIPLNGSENMVIGKSDAKAAIIEFSDYECPYCAKHYKNVLPALRKAYIDKGAVKYVMKDFPLEFHAHAKKASLAARCAGEQGHYWPMHDAIFEARGQASDSLVDNVVKQVKLDGVALKQCLEDPAQLAKVEADIALGAKLGINGTPSFLVGRIKDKQLVDYRRLDGLQSLEAFVGILDGFKK
jgi:protein-disulfide isomerase